jgi:uncharacterized membrane protein
VYSTCGRAYHMWVEVEIFYKCFLHVVVCHVCLGQVTCVRGLRCRLTLGDRVVTHIEPSTGLIATLVFLLGFVSATVSCILAWTFLYNGFTYGKTPTIYPINRLPIYLAVRLSTYLTGQPTDRLANWLAD